MHQQKVAILSIQELWWKIFNIIICNKKNHATITLKNQLLVTNVAKKIISKGTVQFLNLKNYI